MAHCRGRLTVVWQPSGSEECTRQSIGWLNGAVLLSQVCRSLIRSPRRRQRMVGTQKRHRILQKRSFERTCRLLLLEALVRSLSARTAFFTPFLFRKGLSSFIHVVFVKPCRVRVPLGSAAVRGLLLLHQCTVQSLALPAAASLSPPLSLLAQRRLLNADVERQCTSIF